MRLPDSLVGSWLAAWGEIIVGCVLVCVRERVSVCMCMSVRVYVYVCERVCFCAPNF